MTWKSGKHGDRTVRTVRSSFSTRNEGILVLKETSLLEESESDPEERKANAIVYSLGKQNRWLMPAMVRDSSDLRSDFGDKDFLFVERRGMDGPKSRGDCISVYERSSGKTWEPKGKYGQMDNLVQRASETDVVLEVTYPNRKGVWPFNSDLKYTQKSSRKKYHGSKRKQLKVDVHVDEDGWQQLWDMEDSLLCEDHFDIDYGDEDDSMIDHTVSLGDYICESQLRNKTNSNPGTNKSYNPRVDSKLCHSSSIPKSKMVLIDDEEMATEHKKMFDRARNTDSLLTQILTGYYWDNKWSTKKDKYLRNRLKLFHEEEDENDTELKGEEPKLLHVPEQPNGQESFSVEHLSCEAVLVNEDLETSKLKTMWDDMYHEAASSPRKFAIIVSDMSCLTTSLTSAYILFELNGDRKQAANQCQASIKLLLDSELSELKMSGEIAQLISSDFCYLIGRNSNAMRVKDIVEKAIMCIRKHEREWSKKDHIAPSKTSTSLYVFESLLGWKGKCYTEEEALTEIMKEITEKNRNEEPLLSESFATNVECGICFEDLTDKACNVFTTTKSCSHSFCNSCWKLYLEIQICSGQVDVLCPGHRCKALVDLVTIMSLAPSLYGKYSAWKTKRSMECSPTWKNCPADKCSLVMKVSPCRDDTKLPVPACLPVACGCKSIWCFSCQEQAHWPSPCDVAQKFRAKNMGYADAKKAGRFSQITTVSIKHCPKCHYPIEKNDGCKHMHCIMCGTEFCWHCVKLWSIDCCNEMLSVETSSTIIELPRLTSDAQTFADIAVASFCTVNAGITVQTHQNLKSMKQGLGAYSSLKKLSKKLATSRMGSILENMKKNKITHLLKKAHYFKLQAHVALEGMSICIVSGVSDEILRGNCLGLSLLMDKIAAILSNPVFMHKGTNVAKLNEHIESGQRYLMELSNHVPRNHK